MDSALSSWASALGSGLLAPAAQLRPRCFLQGPGARFPVNVFLSAAIIRQMLSPARVLCWFCAANGALAGLLEKPLHQLGGSAIPTSYLLKHLDGVPKTTQRRLICAQPSWDPTSKPLVTLGQQPIGAQDGMLAVFRRPLAPRPSGRWPMAAAAAALASLIRSSVDETARHGPLLGAVASTSLPRLCRAPPRIVRRCSLAPLHPKPSC
ncbi:uncharacterized protein TRIVIDRAFT_61852 [Trichoderma virens Gv29-8]|uniref:Uncharacterized protein n=1 Tax=Hypocrea virens (strain Gv29-8 / FGSC 10586) TaxID=413071 RepID=G9MI20_HYPVG|nr:uncharacterized protein TRIVIDRAFT_61852 [Trichoderma virens Gv29-8]EHK25139.1 hypothetical protein TRIVIDRAFT_61852 [Trichoderma virens Gv29-8]UKZ49037.1 hypothetical protein TrVGV298_003275 [Trichoderma virens]